MILSVVIDFLHKDIGGKVQILLDGAYAEPFVRLESGT